MLLSFSHVNYISSHIRLYHEKRLLVSSDPKSLTLTERKELSAIVLPHHLRPRMDLVTRLLNMLMSTTIGLRLECYGLIRDRLAQKLQSLIGDIGDAPRRDGLPNFREQFHLFVIKVTIFVELIINLDYVPLHAL